MQDSQQKIKKFLFKRREDNDAQTPQTETAEENPFIAAEENERYRRMEREFEDYRKRKVLSKIDRLITGEGALDDVREEIRSVASGARAVVVPRLAKAAKRALSDSEKMEVLVDYPFAGGPKKAVLCEIKAAFRLKASVLVCVSVSAFASGNVRALEKTLNVLRRLSRKKTLTPVFSAAGLGAEQIGKLALMIKSKGFGAVAVTYGEPNATADAVKLLCDALGDKIPVRVAGKISTAEEAERLFLAGADRLITADYLALSRSALDGIDLI